VIERTLEPLGQLLLGEDPIGACLATRDEVAVSGDVRVERHLVCAVTPAPEPVTVARLVHGNAVDPGAQARVSAESMDGAENTEEDFL